VLLCENSAELGDQVTENRRVFDVVIVGAGFAGLYMLYRVRGLGLTARVYEAGGGVGGTWYWNRYPGARCDVESMQYSYQFSEELQQEWEWSERYAPQAEILRYLEHVADRFGLRPDIEFDTRVTAANFDEASDRWTVHTEQVHTEQVHTEHEEAVSAQFVIFATGCLSTTNVPEIEGAQSFAGSTFHTGRWPHSGVDLSGQRVGVIGTGSSAVQSIPILAQQVRELVVFQRTATYSVPAWNGPLDPAEVAEIKDDYAGFRAANRQTLTAIGDKRPRTERLALEVSAAERHAEYASRWADGGLPFLGAFADLLFDQRANETAAGFVRDQIRSIVDDPRTAEILCPDQVVGCKRMCVDTGYYATFNRSNVHLVDLRTSPIAAITRQGIRTTDRQYELDAIIYATGFDAMTGALSHIRIQGKDGVALKDAWAGGPGTYLGLGVAGFPNLFIITGPGSPSVLTNMIVSIEQHVDWIADCIAYLRQNGFGRIEATPDAQAAWVEYVNALADFTLFPTCNSWYLGANVPGKPRVFMPCLGFPPYAEKCEEIARNGYEGFVLEI
jgi:cation diffusion facilitator CzcD-associated flavoprotein CzcO